MYFLFLYLLGTVGASTNETKGLEIRLISETTTIVPGQPFTVGLHIEHKEGYHTYWKKPGIVGFATQIKWQLPKGFRASEIQWPYPELTKMASHPCHGYERDVTLLVTITPPTKIATSEVTLRADTQWMCCADTCHPGSKNLSLTLKISTQTSPDDEAVQFIRQAQQEIPRASKAWRTTMLSGLNEQKIQLKINPPAGATPKAVYLFSSDGQVSSDKKQTITLQQGGSWLLTAQRCEFSPKEPTHFPAVLKVDDQYISINPKYPNKIKK